MKVLLTRTLPRAGQISWNIVSESRQKIVGYILRVTRTVNCYMGTTKFSVVLSTNF